MSRKQQHHNKKKIKKENTPTQVCKNKSLESASESET